MTLVKEAPSSIAERLTEVDNLDGSIVELTNELQNLKAERKRLAEIHTDIRLVANVIGRFVQQHELNDILEKLIEYSRPSRVPRNRP